MLTTMATSALLHHDPSGNNADGSLLMGRPSPASSTGLYCDAYHQCKHLPEVSRDSGCDATMDGSDDDEELSVGSESPPPIPSDAPILDSGSGLESDLTSPSPAPSPDNQEVPISNNHRPENRIVEVVNHNNANNNGNNNNNNPPVRTLKFSIDNILKPEFGRPSSGGCRKSPTPVAAQRLTQPPAPARNSKPATAKQKNSECDGKKDEKSTASNGADADNQPIDLSKLPPSTYSGGNTNSSSSQPLLWPAWVYCTRYSDRPSSGRSPRSRRMKRKEKKPEEKRPRTAFTSEQLARLKQEFQENRYLTEKRRQALARDLKLNESQIKIWFQNKRAKIKKASGQKNPLALQLMAQGLYNHSTIPVRDDEEESTDKELKSTDK